jgi:hypothetical protein
MGKSAARLACFVLLYGLVGAAAAFDPNTDPNLIAWWKLDEGSGGVAADSTGHGYDGRLRGDPAWVQGFFRGGLLLDGTDDYVEVSTPLNLRSNHVTITAWAHVNGRQSEWSAVVASRAGSTIFGIHYGPAGDLRYDWNGVTWGWVSGLPIPDQEWFFTAVVIEPTKATLYLNKQSAVNAVAHDIEEFNSTLVIGQDPGGGRFLRGIVDDVRIFSRSLSPVEVKAMVPPKLKAYKPIPEDGAVGVTLSLLQWTKGETAVFHDVYVGTSPDLRAADLQPRAYIPMVYYAAGFTPGVTYYWRVDEVNGKGVVYTGDVWSFTAMPLTAYLPLPPDGAANVVLDLTLTWAAGQTATSHHLYFGADPKAVEEGAAGVDKGQFAAAETSYRIPEALKPDTTYYWRVDESRLDGGTTGSIWSFSTVWPGPTGAIRQWWLNIGSGTTVADLTGNGNFPDNPTGTEFVTLMEGPVNWADNYGSRLYGWVYPPQSGDYTFWIASDDLGELWLSTDQEPANKKLIANVATWTNPREWGKEANQRSAPITLQAGNRYYIEALMKEAGSGDNIAVAWQGPGFNMEVLGAGGVGPTPYLPLRAYSPSPADGAVDTVQSLTLTWSAGEKALKHEVYFGDDATAVAAADSSSSLFKGSQSGTSYDAGDLEWGKTYFWRVDEINAGEADSPWVGRIWTFTTANFIPVDDFESYTDEDVGRIFQTWIDGWGYTTPEPGNPGNGTGATVGYIDPPFAEHTIVHGGKQSMPLAYDNSNSPFYSEAERTFDSAQNWTDHGMNTLSLWVRGNPEVNSVSVTETSGKMTLTGAGTDIWNANDEFTYAYKSLNGDATIVAKVTSIGPGTNTWAKGGVMIRDSLDGGSLFTMMVMTANSDGTAGNGASFQYRATAYASSNLGNVGATAVVAPPYWVKLERIGDTFTGYNSPDGIAWTMIGTQDVVMSAPVYIGICVTSHQAEEQRTFQFEGIKTTGSVTGAWQGALIASPRYNSAQNLYVAVQDSAGKVAVVTDATPVNATDWVEVQMPLSGFTGVSMTKVKKMFIGVGDRNNPVADGTGVLFIDDIRVTKPAGL